MGIFDRFAKRSASGSDASRPAQREATTLRALTPEEKAQLEERIDELTELGLVDSPVALDLWFLANKPAAADGTATPDVVEKQRSQLPISCVNAPITTSPCSARNSFSRPQ